jgi:hypothetical protein
MTDEVRNENCSEFCSNRRTNFSILENDDSDSNSDSDGSEETDGNDSHK